MTKEEFAEALRSLAGFILQLADQYDPPVTEPPPDGSVMTTDTGDLMVTDMGHALVPGAPE